LQENAWSIPQDAKAAFKEAKQRLNGDCDANDTKRYIRKEIVN